MYFIRTKRFNKHCQDCWERIDDYFKKLQILHGRPYSYESTNTVDEVYNVRPNKFRVTRHINADGSLVRIGLSALYLFAKFSFKSESKSCISKKRLLNVDIHRPRFNVDFRIDINIEKKGLIPGNSTYAHLLTCRKLTWQIPPEPQKYSTDGKIADLISTAYLDSTSLRPQAAP